MMRIYHYDPNTGAACGSSDADADPLGDFLRSLEQYHGLPSDCRVFPAHGIPFLGLHERLDQLTRHHDQRLELSLAACREPASAAEVLRAQALDVGPPSPDIGIVAAALEQRLHRPGRFR